MIFLAVVPFVAVTVVDILIAAGVSVAAGAGIKAAYDKVTGRDEKTGQRGYERGQATGRAKHEQQLDEMAERIRTAVNDQRFFKIVVALANVGYAYVIARDGFVSDEKSDLIHDFLIGHAIDFLPERFIEQLDKCRGSRISLAVAHEFLGANFPEATGIANQLVQLLGEDDVSLAAAA